MFELVLFIAFIWGCLSFFASIAISSTIQDFFETFLIFCLFLFLAFFPSAFLLYFCKMVDANTLWMGFLLILLGICADSFWDNYFTLKFKKIFKTIFYFDIVKNVLYKKVILPDWFNLYCTEKNVKLIDINDKFTYRALKSYLSLLLKDIYKSKYILRQEKLAYQIKWYPLIRDSYIVFKKFNKQYPKASTEKLAKSYEDLISLAIVDAKNLLNKVRDYELHQEQSIADEADAIAERYSELIKMIDAKRKITN